jgi:diguanylate cyclase (GGDEF)-like protein
LLAWNRAAGGNWWSRTALKTLLIPGGLLLFSATAFVYSAWRPLEMPSLTFIYYSALIGGALLAWRFHSSRIFSALVVVFVAQQSLARFGMSQPSVGSPGWTALHALALLVPLNFILIALMQEHGFSLASIAPVGLFLFVQSVIVAVLYAGTVTSTRVRAHPGPATTISLPDYALIAFAAAAIFLLVRYFLTRKPADCALFWSLLACFLAIRFVGALSESTIYAITAACILAVSIIENSYLLAYHDELTTLPSRRAFNDALVRLQDTYSIAVVDIDHFKIFNDTYGHDTGDQVLRLVAANLAQVTGGGQAYRCGGEEFNILFPGKTTAEVVDHLEQLRLAIESSEFHVRSGERRRASRGADRRAKGSRSRARKGHLIRQLAQPTGPVPVSVTVSIGVAASTEESTRPDAVLVEADKALYRAKANGRNRVEAARAGRRRTRAKAVDIA